MRGSSEILAATLAPWILAGSAVATPLELPLEAAIARALEANRALASSRRSRDAEALSVGAARSAFDLKIVPTSTLGRIGTDSPSSETNGWSGSVGVQLRKTFESGTTVSLGPSYNRSGRASNTGLDATLHQPLTRAFDPEVVLDNVHRAEFALASFDNAHRRLRERLALETVGAYHDAIRNEQLTRISNDLGERLHRHALVASRKEKAELSGPSDTFRAQIRLKDAEDAGHQSRVAFELAKGRLRQILALPADADLRLSSPPPPAVDVRNAVQRALGNSTELAQARTEFAEGQRTARIAAHATLPDVSLHLAYGNAIADPLLQSLVPVTQRRWSAYVQVAGDVARSTEKLNHRRALVRMEALAVAIEDKTLEVERAVQQQIQILAGARARIELRETQVRQARGKLSLAEVKVAHDMADNFELIEAEGDLYRARSELAGAQMEYALAAYALNTMTGDFP